MKIVLLFIAVFCLYLGLTGKAQPFINALFGRSVDGGGGGGGSSGFG